jgi:hypothetical protein
MQILGKGEQLASDHSSDTIEEVGDMEAHLLYVKVFSEVLRWSVILNLNRG